MINKMQNAVNPKPKTNKNKLSKKLNITQIYEKCLGGKLRMEFI